MPEQKDGSSRSAAGSQIKSTIKTAPWLPIIQHDGFRNFFAGSMAGLFIAYTTFPLEAMKKLRQVGIKRAEYGVPFYRGSAVFAGNIIPTTALQFGINNLLSPWAGNDAPKYQQFAVAMASGIGGAVTATFVENTIIRQQVMRCGPIAAIQDMAAQSYLRPWKSFPLIAGRDAIFTAWMFIVAPTVRTHVDATYGSSYILPASIAIGVLGATLSHPFDTMATRLQKTHARLTYGAVCRNLITEFGKMGLLRGLPFRMLLFIIFSNVLPEAEKDAEFSLRTGHLPESFFFKRLHDRFTGKEHQQPASPPACPDKPADDSPRPRPAH